MYPVHNANVSRYVECIKRYVSRAQRYVSHYVECIKPNVSRAQRYVSRYVECIKPNVSRAQRYNKDITQFSLFSLKCYPALRVTFLAHFTGYIYIL
ncbi:hypothetical protein H5410_042569 [Solanum commersonii]|uniref:Uncharacterized protein n=1 Tax=Solanum commersonii TaxID=4109 RepID=A0A9J5XWR1_SOLCO|nr:hypothetical protein H5410_042569 [Solanum commersonii]